MTVEFECLSCTEGIGVKIKLVQISMGLSHQNSFFFNDAHIYPPL